MRAKSQGSSLSSLSSSQDLEERRRREELACIFGYYKMLTGPSPGLDLKVGLINCRYKPGPQLASLPG